jgi:PST family polysaccharide transporter
MSETGGQKLRDSAYRGAIATILQQGGRLGTQVVSLIILARLLTPEDFGIYAMVLPIVAVMGLFQGMGLADAVIQRRDITPEQINTLYWINFAFCCGVAIILVLVAPFAAWFYKEPRVAVLTAAFALPTLIGAAAQQQYAIYMRELRFLSLAVIDFACVLTGFVTAVVGALIFHSYWALWASTVASGLLWAVASTAASTWRPSAPSFKANTDGMLKFGARMTVVAFVDFLARSTDKALIGRFWGAVALGFYDRAYRLVLFPLQNVSWPLARMAVPLLARLRDEPDRLRWAYLRIVGQINMIAVPGVVVALAAPEVLIRVALGEDWTPAAQIFAWLGLAAMLQPMMGLTNGMLTVQGRTGAMLRCSLINGLVAVGAILIGLPHGAVGVARALALAQVFICVPVMIHILCLQGPLRRIDFALAFAPFALGAAATWGTVRLMASAGLDGVPLLIVAGVWSYSMAIVGMLAFPTGRATLDEARKLVEHGLGVLQKALPRLRRPDSPLDDASPPSRPREITAR